MPVIALTRITVPGRASAKPADRMRTGSGRRPPPSGLMMLPLACTPATRLGSPWLRSRLHSNRPSPSTSAMSMTNEDGMPTSKVWETTSTSSAWMVSVAEAGWPWVRRSWNTVMPSCPCHCRLTFLTMAGALFPTTSLDTVTAGPAFPFSVCRTLADPQVPHAARGYVSDVRSVRRSTPLIVTT